MQANRRQVLNAINRYQRAGLEPYPAEDILLPSKARLNVPTGQPRSFMVEVPQPYRHDRI